MILCIGTTPAVQRVMVFRKLFVDAVNRAVTTIDGAAGKSVNVAKVLKALGEEPVVTGFVGGQRGELLLGILKAKGIREDFVRVEAETRQCITVIDEAAGSVTELVEESRAVKAENHERLLEAIGRRMELGNGIGREEAQKTQRKNHEKLGIHEKGCRAVVMSGTITPGGPEDFYGRCVKMTREAGAMSVVDARGALLLEALKAGPDVVKPNRAELAATVGGELRSEEDVIEAMRVLTERGARQVVVTAGKEATLVCDERNVWRVHGPKIVAVNPIGSGDAFTAALAWRLAKGDDLGEAARWGAAAGAANALSQMPGELERSAVERLVREGKVEKVKG